MARKRLPVLTSPWKVGFFVSLMLVSISIGVAYFFMRTFDLSWGIRPFEPTVQWFQTEVLQGVLNGDGFLVRMSPMLAIVGVTALFSYIVITAAVRKYKRYLDSGHDYKNLIAGIENIDDLTDKDRIDQLKNHPEIKAFLLRTREQIDKRTQELDQREDALANRVQEAGNKKEADIGKQLSDECQTIIEAIQTGSGTGFPQDLNLTMVELKGVEEAFRNALQRSGASDSLGQSDSEAAVANLQSENQRMRAAITEIARELEDSSRDASGIEQQISQLSAGGCEVDPASIGAVQNDLHAVSASVETLDKLSASLTVLGEEAKGTAINTALQASSGKATQADLIQLAEDVKEVAAKFGEVSRSYSTTTVGMKETMNTLTAQLTRIVNALKMSGGSQGALGNSIGQVNLLVERVVLLSDRAQKLKQSPATESNATIQPGSGYAPSESDFAFESIERKPVFSEEAADDALSGVVPQTGEVLDEMAEDNMFADLSAKPDDLAPATPPPATPSAPAPAAPQQPVPTAPPVEPIQPAQPVQAAPPVEPTPAPAVAPIAAEATPQDFVADPSAVDLPGIDLEANTGDVASQMQDMVSPSDMDDGAVDLYALGAMDYDPAVHA